MDEEAAIEEQLRRSVRPDTEDVPKHVLHCLERDQTDGVVQEMHCHVCEHHQAGNEPQPPDHRRTRRSSSGSVKTVVIGARSFCASSSTSRTTRDWAAVVGARTATSPSRCVWPCPRFAWLQQVLHLVEHQVVSRGEGDPLNAASITARSRGGDLSGLTGNSERELTVSGL